jgi:hypothetical protein
MIPGRIGRRKRTLRKQLRVEVVKSHPRLWKAGEIAMFGRIHTDAISVIVAIILLAGGIALLLYYLNPMH